MSATNGVKMFLFVIRHEYEESDGSQGVSTYLLRSDHDPTRDEIVNALGFKDDEISDIVEAFRYSEEEVPTLPPKT